MHLIYKVLDGFSDRVGRVVCWFALAMVLIQFTLVIMRYVYSASNFMSLSTLWWQESIVYLHGSLIMFGVAYTYLHNGHVRVDIFYRDASPRRQDWTDLIGCLLFLLPVCYLIWWSALPSVMNSWRILERSQETSGIPYRYLLRTTVLVMSVLLALQALSTALKATLRLLGHQVDDPFRGEESLD
ncbi:MAG: TRAP transporter small permease subunit [Rhodobacteraceae bacterium]|nr:MAG: TRAP transporter small permease subunit [Paracoccaceae bacterium]